MANGAMMKNPEKHENYSRNPTTNSPESAKTQPQHDISKEDVRFEIPEPLIAWLVKINHRYSSLNKSS